jgi:hypothetical protein
MVSHSHYECRNVKECVYKIWTCLIKVVGKLVIVAWIIYAAFLCSACVYALV